MDLDELIGKLMNVRANFPGSKVVIATARQVVGNEIPGYNAGFRTPIAANACLGDERGELDSLFIVTVEVDHV